MHWARAHAQFLFAIPRLRMRIRYPDWAIPYLITERSEVYTRVDRVFVRFLCELLKLRCCLLEGVQLHRRLQGCQTK